MSKHCLLYKRVLTVSSPNSPARPPAAPVIYCFTSKPRQVWAVRLASRCRDWQDRLLTLPRFGTTCIKLCLLLKPTSKDQDDAPDWPPHDHPHQCSHIELAMCRQGMRRAVCRQVATHHHRSLTNNSPYLQYCVIIIITCSRPLIHDPPVSDLSFSPSLPPTTWEKGGRAEPASTVRREKGETRKHGIQSLPSVHA